MAGLWVQNQKNFSGLGQGCPIVTGRAVSKMGQNRPKPALKCGILATKRGPGRKIAHNRP
jgi:hypothetical protein